MTEQDRKAYWEKHFSEQHADGAMSGTRKLDFSNDRVRTQTYGWILEACGIVGGKRCLDAGCGTGEIALLLAALGGEVEAFDIAPAAVSALQSEHPGIRWFVGDVGDVGSSQIAAQYDLIISSEVLQYVDAGQAIARMWPHLAPGGRLIGVVPYASCPIVQSVQKRFDDHYQGIALDTLRDLADSLPGVAQTWWRGAAFLDDQTLLPYGLSPWCTDFQAPQTPPNRIQFVLLREGG